MKIAIVNLTSGGLSSGYRKYLAHVLPRLRAQAQITGMDVFMPPGLEHAVEGPVLTWPAGDERRGFRALRRRLRSLEPDVVFIPTARWLDTAAPTVVMVHNMEPLTCPVAGHTLAEAARNLARRWVARRACLRATRVIAVSRHVRKFVCDRWRVPADRVGLVYHGIESVSSWRPVRPAALEGLHGRWVFTAGSIRPARGLEDAVAALGRLDQAVRLVVAGVADPSTGHYARALRQTAARMGVSERVIWVDRLRPEEMAWCYAHCLVFVTTTRAEACPNIALEAMSHGCSIVATDLEPMPEFFGQVARFYAAGDAAALAVQVGEAIAESDDERGDRAATARGRVLRFTWDETVRQTVRQLEAAELERDRRPSA